MLLALFNQVEKLEFTSVLEEVQFYCSYLENLESVEKQIESPETNLTKKILNVKKKYQSVANFENDINFKTHINDIRLIAEFMKGIKINDFLASTDIKDLRKNLEDIWVQM